MVIRDILLARRTGGHVHLCHMSTRGSVELIRWGKERGIHVTAEVCPHHLSLTEDAVEGYNTNAKMNPPLRTADDVAALQEAVRDGTIDLIATDHAPHHYDEKEREFADAPNGIVGLETALAVVVTHLVVPGILELVNARRSHVDDPGEGVRPARWHAPQGKCGRRHSLRPRRGVDGRSGPVPVQGAQFALSWEAAEGAGDLYHRRRTGRLSKDRWEKGDGRWGFVTDTDIRRGIVRVCKLMYERGLIAGPDGNVSVRISFEHVLVTPRGFSKAAWRRMTWCS